jgi:dimeric dUTPase (all-alpha-NTP-PPase superfamily)
MPRDESPDFDLDVDVPLCVPGECGFNVPDKLEVMFNMQKVLQKRVVGTDLPALLPERLPITVTSIVAELGEILEDEQHWKDWKKNPADTDIAHMRMECADFWHFVINLTLYLGMDAQDIFDEFEAKNAINHERQDNSY